MYNKKMAKNFNRQLFSKKLDLEILKKVMHTYKIKKLNQHVFSRGTLDEINILERLKDIKEELNQYYVPCKAKKYLEDITLKRSVVILRQIIKEFGYKIISREKYKNRVKYISYLIELKDPLSAVELVINFD